VAPEQCISALGGWEGYEVCGWRQEEREGRSWCVLRLRRDRGRAAYCSGCWRQVEALHDVEWRVVRDLPLFEHAVELQVPRVRVACPHCGPKLELLGWLEPYARVTKRLAESVTRLCAVMSIRHVAQYFELNWKTVKEIDKRALARRLGPVDLQGVTVIGMDEFAIQRGHRYATVVIEPSRKRVLWVGRGRSREELRPFFQLLGPQGCAALEAVVMDMSSTYEQEVRANAPQAQIVYDLFHIVAKYGREVIDRVRVDEANRLRADPHARHLVKGARWLLLRNRQNVTREADQVRLRELLAANRALMVAYVLKDDLKELWSYRHEGYARRFWLGWYRRAIRSRIEPLKAFARKLRGYLPGLLAHCRYPLHTSLLEGINNKIKVIKRMAYGFRDDEYFFLKIRAAFPGIG
jgi:transposase